MSFMFLIGVLDWQPAALKELKSFSPIKNCDALFIISISSFSFTCVALFEWIIELEVLLKTIYLYVLFKAENLALNDWSTFLIQFIEISFGKREFVPWIHAFLSLIASVSKWITCEIAWTPASVLPAHTILISSLAIDESASSIFYL